MRNCPAPLNSDEMSRVGQVSVDLLSSWCTMDTGGAMVHRITKSTVATLAELSPSNGSYFSYHRASEVQ